VSPAFGGLTITNLPHDDKRPKTAADWQLPLHSKKVDKMDLGVIESFLNPPAAALFRRLLREICEPRGVPPPPNPIPISRNLPKEDLDLLIEHGHAELVTPEMERAAPTLSYINCFSVMEPEKRRRRLICHPIAANRAVDVEVGHIELLPRLEHIAHLLDVLQRGSEERVASLLDLVLGFWQIQLPRKAWQYQRCRDASGRLAQFKPLTMGHKLAVHLCQLCTAALGGHPAVVNAQLVPHRSVRVDVCVDGLFHGGPPEHTLEARMATLARAKRARATFKVDSNAEPVSKYLESYRGAKWDFTPSPVGTVALADKTRNKLQQPFTVDMKISAIDVIRFGGRAVYAAGLLQYPLARFFPTMQFLRRLCREVNLGIIQRDDFVILHEPVAKSMEQWRRASLETRSPNVRKTAENSIAHVFVDATLYTWGAVLILPDNRVYIVAGRFEDSDFPTGIDRSKCITYCESLAVLKAIYALYRHLQPLSGLVLWEDNTGAEHSIRKGNTRMEHTADVVAEILEATADWKLPISVERIDTKRQFADPLTRDRHVDLERLLIFMSSAEARAATGRLLNQRLGAGRAVVCG
jgi:hypothetical protein